MIVLTCYSASDCVRTCARMGLTRFIGGSLYSWGAFDQTNAIPKSACARLTSWCGKVTYPHMRMRARSARVTVVRDCLIALCIIIAMTFQLSSQILPRILRRTFSVGTLSRMPIKVCTFTVIKSVLKLYAVVIAFERGQIRVDLILFWHLIVLLIGDMCPLICISQ